MPSLVAVALLARDLPDTTDAERRGAAAYVDRSVAAMPDTTRLGLRVASGVMVVLLSVVGRGWFPGLDPGARARAAARVSTLRVPVVGEYVKLTRGLALVSVYESRS